MKQRCIRNGMFAGILFGILGFIPNAFSDDAVSSRGLNDVSSRGLTAGSILPPPPPPPPFLKQDLDEMQKEAFLKAKERMQERIKQNKGLSQNTLDPVVKPRDDSGKPRDDNAVPKSNLAANNSTHPAVDPVSNPPTLQPANPPTPTPAPDSTIPHGQNLVSIDFPNGVNLTDIIKTIGVWAGKNFVLGQGVASNVKISIIAPEPMTKEEAYQTFLSALNISGFTTVETGQITKILPIPTAKSTNIKTYYGANWAPETDEIINQVIPLRFIDAKTVLDQLRPILGLTQNAYFTSTNAIILTDTGFRIKSLLEIIQLLDNKKDQAQVEIVPINHMDAKDANQKITDIFGNKYGPSLSLQKSIVDERTNSLILIGPARGLDDIVKFIKRIDTPTGIESAQGLIRVRPLDYADAEKLAQTLQAFSQNQNKIPQSPYFPPRFPPYQPNQPQNPEANGTAVADLSNVKIAADKSTNSLIIQGSKGAYAEIETLIQALDKRRDQIYLEADILDLAVQNGLDWAPSALGGSTINGNRFLMPFGFSPLAASNFSLKNNGSTTDFQQALAAIGSNFLLGILSNTAVNLGGYSIKPGALLFALKTDSNTNILQTPSMLVADNETAKFNSTEQYRTVVNVPNPNGQGIVGSPQEYNVTTELTVTPQSARADYITMKINLKLDDADQADIKTGYPNPIKKRSADSVVTLRSGQTAVMGGITKESNKKTEAKIPLLGDIPILGWLFKIVQSSKVKSNLTLFLTPHVVRNADDLARIYKKKLEDRDEFLKLYYGKNFKKEDFYKKLPNEEQGKAIPEKSKSALDPAVKPRDDNGKPRDDNGSVSSRGLTAGSSEAQLVLPSQNRDPIIAPSQNATSAVPQSPNNFPPAPPPPPPVPFPAPQ